MGSTPAAGPPRRWRQVLRSTTDPRPRLGGRVGGRPRTGSRRPGATGPGPAEADGEAGSFRPPHAAKPLDNTNGLLVSPRIQRLAVEGGPFMRKFPPCSRGLRPKEARRVLPSLPPSPSVWPDSRAPSPPTRRRGVERLRGRHHPGLAPSCTAVLTNTTRPPTRAVTASGPPAGRRLQRPRAQPARPAVPGLRTR